MIAKATEITAGGFIRMEIDFSNIFSPTRMLAGVRKRVKVKFIGRKRIKILSQLKIGISSRTKC
jgi:hypothetical protein